MKTPTKELNFLPAEIILQRMRTRTIFVFTLLATLGVALLGVAVYTPIYLEKMYRAKIDQYQAQYATLEAALPYYNQLQSLEAQYQQSQKVIRTLEGQRKPIVKIINQISSVLPPGVRVTKMEVDVATGVSLEVQTPGPTDTARLIVGLRNLGLFEQVEPKEVTLQDKPGTVKLQLPFKGVASYNASQESTDSGALEGENLDSEFFTKLLEEVPKSQ
ncbi:MAG: hypothetical protein GX755_09720 [Syntrophomonadaceae bacterium]|nr:hypothetical protein [Syntrophomonadaceae bacterium]